MAALRIAAWIVAAVISEPDPRPNPLLIRPPAAPRGQPMELPRARECTEPACERRDWHAGLNLRTDFGTHPLRLDGGGRFGRFDVVLVLDPMVWLDAQADNDLIVDIGIASGWSAFAGWRTSFIGIADGTHWQQKSLVGLGGRLPSFASGHLRAQWGLELAVLWIKHGAGLPTETLSFGSARDYLDHFNFGMFVRFEYASGF